MTYDIAKTKAILFSQLGSRRIKDEISGIRLMFGVQEVAFSDKANQWLGVWLDRGLTISTYIKEKLKQAQEVEARIRGLTGTYRLFLELVQKNPWQLFRLLHYLALRSGGAGRKYVRKKFKSFFNKQKRAMTSMYQSTLVATLVSDSGLIATHILLDYRQRKYYAYRLLTLPDGNLAKEILLITLRLGNGNAQPGELPEDDEV